MNTTQEKKFILFFFFHFKNLSSSPMLIETETEFSVHQFDHVTLAYAAAKILEINPGWDFCILSISQEQIFTANFFFTANF